MLSHPYNPVKASSAHLHNAVALPDVCQELVAQALALAGALHQPRNVLGRHNGAGWNRGVGGA